MCWLENECVVLYSNRSSSTIHPNLPTNHQEAPHLTCKVRPLSLVSIPIQTLFSLKMYAPQDLYMKRQQILRRPVVVCLSAQHASIVRSCWVEDEQEKLFVLFLPRRSYGWTDKLRPSLQFICFALELQHDFGKTPSDYYKTTLSKSKETFDSLSRGNAWVSVKCPSNQCFPLPHPREVAMLNLHQLIPTTRLWTPRSPLLQQQGGWQQQEIMALMATAMVRPNSRPSAPLRHQGICRFRRSCESVESMWIDRKWIIVILSYSCNSCSFYLSSYWNSRHDELPVWCHFWVLLWSPDYPVLWPCL